MRLCKHDWYIHKVQKGNSLRHELIIGSDTWPWFTIGLFYAMGAASLNLTPVPWWGILPLAVIVGAAMLVIFVMCFESTPLVRGSYDPWKDEDKSCLKCGKIKFTATKTEDKIRRRMEARSVREHERQVRRDNKEEKKHQAGVIRGKNLKLAHSRYKKLLELQ